MDKEHVHISYNVSKLGEKIPSVNLPAGPTCRPDAPCFKICYARHGRFQFENVKTPFENNLRLWEEEPEKFEREVQMAAYLAAYFRWHSSGDIVNYEYLEMMCRVAMALPGTKFLAFTKRYEFVNKYLDEHGSFPENLSVVLSAWGDWVPDNPHNLPMSFVRLKNGDGEAKIPDTAHPCSGFCGDCIHSKNSCWDLKRGESVAFKQH